MLNMILKDLRISPLRNILSGISMFVGIIAMISSFLVGTLGKEYLISVNAQMYGWSPTYSFSITGSDFQDTIKMENFFREIYNTDHFVAVTFSMLEEITVAPVASVSSLQDISDTVYKKTVPVDVVFTTSTYNKIYNLPMSSGDWFDSSEINKTLCMVVNKAAQNYFDTSLAVLCLTSCLVWTFTGDRPAHDPKGLIYLEAVADKIIQARTGNDRLYVADAGEQMILPFPI